jgi:hypothetical protein
MGRDTQNLNAKAERSRRNFLKMGTIGASAIVAVLASAKRGVADGRGHENDGNCFLRGTTILTADGDRKIEDLTIGDLLPTVFGGIRPIQWIGRYPFRRSDPSKPWPEMVRPVRIARSALAPNVPHTDLYVTQWHSLFIDDVLVPAGSLINETTITLCQAREMTEMEFFNIKIDSHDVIYAEGAPVETLLNVDECAVNFAEYFRLYGAPTSAENPCAPILSCVGRRNRFMSHFRSAIPGIDCRRQIDVIRDRVEERGIVLSRQLEPSF